jgi:hypothetical protein
MLFTGCAGFAEWDHPLPNNYCVTYVNSMCIVFGKRDVVTEQLEDPQMEPFIIDFCYSDSYIGLKRFAVSPMEFGPREEAFFGCTRENTSEMGYHYKESDLEYYLVDAFADKVYGPYTAEEYQAQCKKQNVTGMCDWISTTD